MGHHPQEESSSEWEAQSPQFSVDVLKTDASCGHGRVTSVAAASSVLLVGSSQGWLLRHDFVSDTLSGVLSILAVQPEPASGNSRSNAVSPVKQAPSGVLPGLAPVPWLCVQHAPQVPYTQHFPPLQREQHLQAVRCCTVLYRNVLYCVLMFRVPIPHVQVRQWWGFQVATTLSSLNPSHAFAQQPPLLSLCSLPLPEQRCSWQGGTPSGAV